MGNRLYFDQLLSDSSRHHQLSVTDVHDIGTVKDYMKVSKLVIISIIILLFLIRLTFKI